MLGSHQTLRPLPATHATSLSNWVLHRSHQTLRSLNASNKSLKLSAWESSNFTAPTHKPQVFETECFTGFIKLYGQHKRHPGEPTNKTKLSLCSTYQTAVCQWSGANVVTGENYVHWLFDLKGSATMWQTWSKCCPRAKPCIRKVVRVWSRLDSPSNLCVKRPRWEHWLKTWLSTLFVAHCETQFVSCTWNTTIP